MSTREFTKSPEGEAEFKKYGLEYPSTMDDEWMEKYDKITRLCPKEERKTEIQNLVRLLLPPDDLDDRDDVDKWKSYIYHDQTHIRTDALGNPIKKYQANIGLVPKVIPKYQISVNPDEGYAKEKKITGYDVEKTYSLPFSKENIASVKKLCTNSTSYMIKQNVGGQKFVCKSFKDWSEALPSELLALGRKPLNAEEKQYCEDLKSGKLRIQAPAHTPAYR